ncbi:MAG: secretion protein HlyD [Betaproteobacteria bacterium]|nr:secretion protein HlyD [Betaproteobacteria bacterium]
MMSFNKRRVVLPVLLVLAVIAAYTWHVLHAHASPAVVLYGNVDIRETDLAFRQSGRLKTMLVDEGARVNAGQLLATLDDVPFQEAVAGAEANVAQARAELTKLYHGNRPQQVAEAREAVRQAVATDQNARADAARQRGLLANGASSQRIVDAANAASDAADANLAAARQQLNLMVVGSRQEDIDAGVAQLAVAQANLAQARTALSDTRVFAPVDAIVLSRVREPGSMVSPVAPVYTLTAITPVYVRAYARETELGKMVPGTQVKVFTDSSQHVYTGTVGFVSPQAEFTPKSVETTDLRTDLVYRIRVTIDHPDEHLRQGMPVTVRFAS